MDNCQQTMWTEEEIWFGIPKTSKEDIRLPKWMNYISKSQV